MPRRPSEWGKRQIPHVDYPSKITSNLSTLMDLAGVTWDDLEAQGITRTTISRLSTNIETGTLRMLKRVASALGVSVHDLFSEVEPGEEPTREQVWAQVLDRAAEQLKS